MIATRYGTVTDFLALAGDRLVAIEVTRQSRQRPVKAIASWRVSGAATPDQVNGVSRLLVYRGHISNEADPNWNLTILKPWDAVDGGVSVFVDTLVPYGKPMHIDLRNLPDDTATATEGQGLGALLLTPIDAANVLIVNAQLVLTFIGEGADALGTQGLKAV